MTYQLFIDLVKQDGPALIVMDQPSTIGALRVAIAQNLGLGLGLGLGVAYLPGVTMRRVADLRPEQAKTDARDASIIADTARAMPHALRSITLAEENTAELSMALRVR